MSKTLEIVPYDPSWPAAFAAERERLSQALGALAIRIDHHGSTAVPGLDAKPVIDIQVSVRSLVPLERYRTPLEQVGYAHLAHADDAFAPFFHRPSSWPHTHHVHVVQAGGEEERRTLAFRDYLRSHAAVAAEYAALKRRLARAHSGAGPESREAYAEAKSEFVSRITERAIGEGLPADKKYLQ
jgi:GrpB-like predicted nucleotidyltransferase (UPF0157 family)